MGSVGISPKVTVSPVYRYWVPRYRVPMSPVPRYRVPTSPVPRYRVCTMHRALVEGEEADELLQEPPAAHVRQLHGTAQHLQQTQAGMENIP